MSISLLPPLRLAAGIALLLAAAAALAEPAPAPAQQPTAAGGAQAVEWRSAPARPAARYPIALELSDPAGGCVGAVGSVSRRGREVTVRLDGDGGCESGSDGRARTDGSVHWGSPGVHRLRVEDHGGPGGQPRLRGFGLVPVGPARSDTWPEAGFWWNEAGGEFDSGGPGIGLQMERQGDTLSVSVLGYAANGDPQWLIGAGPIEEGIARVPLLRLGDGGGPFGGWRAPGEASQAGVLHLEFLSAARAVAWFQHVLPDGSLALHPMSLVRFRFDQDHGSALQGQWLLLASGEAAPDLLVLSDAASADGGLRLAEASAGRSLECTLDAQRPNSPPPRCVLRDGEGELLVDFTDIALDRMRGWRPDGVSVTALRRRD